MDEERQRRAQNQRLLLQLNGELRELQRRATKTDALKESPRDKDVQLGQSVKVSFFGLLADFLLFLLVGIGCGMLWVWWLLMVMLLLLLLMVMMLLLLPVTYSDLTPGMAHGSVEELHIAKAAWLHITTTQGLPPGSLPAAFSETRSEYISELLWVATDAVLHRCGSGADPELLRAALAEEFYFVEAGWSWRRGAAHPSR